MSELLSKVIPPVVYKTLTGDCMFHNNYSFPTPPPILTFGSQSQLLDGFALKQIPSLAGRTLVMSVPHIKLDLSQIGVALRTSH